ncbi:hypothetical protein [Paraburkholderia sp. BL6665CI2N2]|uniref:hypothetical protein n=1 Tax=Paraburkholderia sp. BL6665CI2N2 TaxID=1938806 RepID=UPI0010653168|nr:hypothetical protein [Paraburkholderia sp. BL6665CI2N2]
MDKFARDAQELQTSVPFEFNNLVAGTRPAVVRIIGTRQVFCVTIQGDSGRLFYLVACCAFPDLSDVRAAYTTRALILHVGTIPILICRHSLVARADASPVARVDA